MSPAEVRGALLAEIERLAPETDLERLDTARPLRDQVDLDSMDWLNFLEILEERLKVEIPEAHYERLGTLDEMVAYLGNRLKT